ncbi:MAG: amino acid permease-associated region [Actinomycetia bacterium]|nr:amino acid permease-associated region [Actinomycetes bacterium]
MAGPAVILSFVIAGVVCLLAAMSYAELSSIVPVAGSAYSFTYVAFGEIWGWLVGWAVILELLLAASVVARAWSLFATQTLTDFGVPIPAALAQVIGHGEGFDVFALLILLLLVLMLATGGRIGLRSLWFMVLAKLASPHAPASAAAVSRTPGSDSGSPSAGTSATSTPPSGVTAQSEPCGSRDRSPAGGAPRSGVPGSGISAMTTLGSGILRPAARATPAASPPTDSAPITSSARRSPLSLPISST